MNATLLGTGASEGIPCVYCTCPTCERARRDKGKDVRTRSSMLVNEEVMIDYSRDIFYQTLNTGLNLQNLRHILLTHFHEDHFNVEEMVSRLCAVPALTEPVYVWLSPSAAEQMELLFKRFHNHNYPDNPPFYFRDYRLMPILPFETVKIGELKVTAVLSSHHGYGVNETGYNFLVEKPDGYKFLYAVDTGWYPEETWNCLSGVKADCVIMECTYGTTQMPDFATEHLNMSNCFHMLRKMTEIGFISETTPTYLTHICHLHPLSFEETERYLSNSGMNIKTGYDGMKLPF